MRRLHLAPLPSPGSRVALEAGPSHHLLRVLRAEPGQGVIVFDGHGLQATARLVESREGFAVVEILDEAHRARPPFPLHLLLGLSKGPAMDAAVRMATEAGATHLHPLRLERSVARGDRRERWERIATSAAAQCGRADVPEILAPTTLRETLASLPPEVDGRVALPGAGRLPPATGPAAVLVGPEGGLTQAEVAAALAWGMRPMGLGPWVLRAETAVAVAVALTAPA